MRKINGCEVIPSAKRLITSLRDLGYTFSSAIADLIDNSIQAGSTEIHIEIELKGINSIIRIADNGYGMTLSQLHEAMRYGSENDYQIEKNLGKFGLGMKTASLSQCRRFTVASRSVNDRQRIIHSYAWDLSHIEKTNKWEILELDNKTRDFVVKNHLKENTGTVILWQHLDRIIEATTDDEKANKIILKLHRELEEHLSMVFHRFLSGEVPDSKIKIFLNHNELIPWDPFVKAEKNTKVLSLVNIPLEFSEIKGTVSLQPYILPNQDDFSSREAFEKASGPRKWNQQQGFYIYRSNRLIQSGGWSRLRTSDEHTKLLRVALNFSPILDDAFKINVAKMRVQIPQQIKEKVDESITAAIRIARDTYNKSSNIKKMMAIPKQFTQISSPCTPIKTNNVQHTDSFNDIRHEMQINLTLGIQKNWLLDDLQIELEKISTNDERPIVKKVFNRFIEYLKKKE